MKSMFYSIYFALQFIILYKFTSLYDNLNLYYKLLQSIKLIFLAIDMFPIILVFLQCKVVPIGAPIILSFSVVIDS